MNIDKLNNYALKIYLDKYDFKKYGMSFSDINIRSIRNILLEISDDISEILNIDLDTEKLYVEVFSQKNGCLIFVSYIPQKKKHKIIKKDIICQFNNFESLKNFCSNINKLYPDSIKNSILYSGRDYIRLILKIKSDFDNISKTVSYYGNIIADDEINRGVTEEYFNMIVSDNAIEQVLLYTSE